MKKNYEINSATLVIFPHGNNNSKVMEEEESYIIEKTPTDIIDESCKYFGSSYLGRFEGTKSLIGVSYKAPIIIEESREIIFFPTCSPRYENCYWISLNNIVKYIRAGHNTLVTFNNGSEITIEMSYHSFENQILRATRLESIFRKRKNY